MIPASAKLSMKNLPGSRLVRLALLTLPVIFTLTWAIPGEANPSILQQSAGSSLTVTEAGVNNGGAVAGGQGVAADIPVSMSPDSGAEGAAVNDGRKNLTAFFSIGVVANILLVAVFLIWAVGQWSKTKQ